MQASNCGKKTEVLLPAKYPTRDEMPEMQQWYCGKVVFCVY